MKIWQCACVLILVSSYFTQDSLQKKTVYMRLKYETTFMKVKYQLEFIAMVFKAVEYSREKRIIFCPTYCM